jgi:hypothetical protein
MAEPSFACRSAQVPVKLKMRCCTAAHCMPCNMPGSLQLKHVFADCLWMRSRATGGGTESICIHSHPMLSAVHIDRAARSEHMAAFWSDGTVALILLPSRTGMLRSKPSPLDTFYRMNGRLGFDQLVLWCSMSLAPAEWCDTQTNTKWSAVKKLQSPCCSFNLHRPFSTFCSILCLNHFGPRKCGMSTPWSPCFAPAKLAWFLSLKNITSDICWRALVPNTNQ